MDPKMILAIHASLEYHDSSVRYGPLSIQCTSYKIDVKSLPGLDTDKDHHKNGTKMEDFCNSYVR